MSRDEQRVQAIRAALAQEGLDGLVCSLPMHVLLISGYWPVVGTSVAVITRDGVVGVIAPEDERDLAERGWADQLRVFHPGSLDCMTNAVQALREPLSALLAALGLAHARMGYEDDQSYQPVTYAAMHLYGGALPRLMKEVAPQVELAPASGLLVQLAAVQTPSEVERVRLACKIVGEAFNYGADHVTVGTSESRTAALFRDQLDSGGDSHDIARSGGFVWCMSGPNSAAACGAYARSRQRPLARGDLVLVHCNSYVDGHWTDVTRTYCLGQPDERKRAMYAAVAEARQAALAAIRPGVKAADVDKAARSVLQARGFGDAFKHSTGHGVGFSAINANARPRLHPKSDDVLQTGMIFNVEPAVYFDGYGGLRHCDVVALTDRGPEVLTPFQGDMQQLWLKV